MTLFGIKKFFPFSLLKFKGDLVSFFSFKSLPLYKIVEKTGTGLGDVFPYQSMSLRKFVFFVNFFFKSTNVVHIIYGKVFNLNQILNSFQNCDVGCYIWNQINSIKFTFNQSPRSIFPKKTNFNSTVAKVLHITLICSSIMSAWGKRVLS